jgi:hypothetical protein
VIVNTLHEILPTIQLKPLISLTKTRYKRIKDGHLVLLRTSWDSKAYQNRLNISKLNELKQ